MKQTISKYDFEQAFKNMGRGDNFSYTGLNALFEYLEQYEEDTGEEIELDVIALCCEYSEFESLEELKQSYNIDAEDFEEAMDELEEYTQVICREEDCIVIQAY